MTAPFDKASLKKNPSSPRTLFGLFMSGVAGLFTTIAIVPLFIILTYLLTKGISSLRLQVFTELPPPPLVEGGGFGNAILGTVIMVGIGGLISVPIGIMAAIYLSEFSDSNRAKSKRLEKIIDTAIKVLIGEPLGFGIGIVIKALIVSVVGSAIGGVIGNIVLIACMLIFPFLLTKVDNIAKWIRFATNVLSGVPSIIVGVFAYSAIVLTTKEYSAWAGGFALAILMLPIIVRTTDEALKLVPQEVRQASIGIGANNYQTVLQVVLPAAIPAIITGVTLAVARAAGETAPLLFTALFTQFWSNCNILFLKDLSCDSLLVEPTASLAVLVYNFAIVPFENQRELAWAAAFILVMLVLATSVISRIATAKRTY